MTPSGMNHMGPPPPGAMDEAPADKSAGVSQMASSEDCVPLAALNLPDEQQQMQAPEQGDKVQYTVEGTVSRIEGDNAYVSREAINGVPVKPDSQEPENPAEDLPEKAGSADQGMAELQDMAGKTSLY